MDARPQVRLVLGRAHSQVADAVVRPCPPGVHRRGDAVLAAAGRAVAESTRTLGRRGPLPLGSTVATPGGDLAALWLLHCCLPAWTVREDLSRHVLAGYRSILAVAGETGSRTVALPLLGSVVPFWPLESAVALAVQALRRPEGDLERVVLTLSSPAALERAAEAFARG